MSNCTVISTEVLGSCYMFNRKNFISTLIVNMFFLSILFSGLPKPDPAVVKV